jgi:hypothetical protein
MPVLGPPVLATALLLPAIVRRSIEELLVLALTAQQYHAEVSGYATKRNASHDCCER